jgi:hypothetical protein
MINWLHTNRRFILYLLLPGYHVLVDKRAFGFHPGVFYRSGEGPGWRNL